MHGVRGTYRSMRERAGRRARGTYDTLPERRLYQPDRQHREPVRGHERAQQDCPLSRVTSPASERYGCDIKQDRWTENGGEKPQPLPETDRARVNFLAPTRHALLRETLTDLDIDTGPPPPTDQSEYPEDNRNTLAPHRTSHNRIRFAFPKSDQPIALPGRNDRRPSRRPITANALSGLLMVSRAPFQRSICPPLAFSARSPARAQ